MAIVSPDGDLLTCDDCSDEADDLEETGAGLLCLPCRKAQCRCESFDDRDCHVHDAEFSYERDVSNHDWSRP